MTTSSQRLREELLYYFDRLPDTLLSEVLTFIKFLLFRAEQSEAPNHPSQEAASPSLDSLVGMFDSGATDVAENHDAYLSQQLKQEQS